MLEVFVERGNQLAEGRRLMKDSPEYAAALALVSIHCAIALNDALLVKLAGSHYAGANHMESVRNSKRQCSTKHIDPKGLKHLEELVRAKNKVSYSTEKTTIETATRLAVASERFETWVTPLINR
jgi:hypothetical protein